MTYYIYQKEDYLNKQEGIYKTLIGCFAVTEKEGKISNFKFTFQEVQPNINVIEQIKKMWSWAFTSNLHFWVEEIPEINSLPDIVMQAIDEHFHVAFENELKFLSTKAEIQKINEIEIPENCPAFLLATVTDIKNELIKVLHREPSELELRITLSVRLIKIVNFLNENPEYMFEFPIYQAYIKKHKLSITEYEVEQFIEDISIAGQVGLDI